MNVRIAEDWKAILQPEFEKPYFGKLVDFVRTEYASHTVFPQGGNIFRAFDKCPLDSLKVVIHAFERDDLWIAAEEDEGVVSVARGGGFHLRQGAHAG